jgi:4-amino-4-deoxy-L-arabinose transferase-like glycosyltransferase
VLQSMRHRSASLYGLLSQPIWRNLCCLIVLAAAIWLPRAMTLDRFVTPDEKRWLTRSANFYHAFAHGDFADTYQQSHPGVTIMWAGTAAFLQRYPAYQAEGPGQLGAGGDVGLFLQPHGYKPLELLKAGRFFIVLAITLVLALSFIASARLIGWVSALIGFLLIASDPFHIALSRLLHLDGLVSSLMLLALLTFLNYLYNGRRPLDLIVSAVTAGLSWLTKSPSIILVPFIGLLALHEFWPTWRLRRRLTRADSQTVLQPLVIWSLIGLAVFILLWPAMWVRPIQSVREILGGIVGHAVEGHELPVYFNGAVTEGDPGWSFYPITYLWRTTPLVLIGLIFAIVALAAPGPALTPPTHQRVTLILMVFAVFFCVLLSVGAKKFDRYLLPMYAPLDLAAAVGWLAAARWLMRMPQAVLRASATALIMFVVAGQFGSALSTFPYYFSYYNPLLGGAKKAPEVMMIGWGEGMDQAADYLNALPNASQLRVTTWFWETTFSYLFKGHTEEGRFAPDPAGILQWSSSDYTILYISQLQRGLYTRQLLDYLARQTPVLIGRAHGLEYVRVYDLRQAPLPEYLLQDDSRFVDWEQSVRLIAYEVMEESVAPNQTYRMAYCFQRLLPVDRDLRLAVRLIDVKGHELQRSEDVLAPRPTRGDVWLVENRLALPADAPPGVYRLELSLYNPETAGLLMARNVHTGEVLGNSVVVGSLVVGSR